MNSSVSTLDTLISRNRDFAAQQAGVGLPIMPSLRTMVICCADPRVDPAHLLGLKPGEAVVIRNIGGRIVLRRCKRWACCKPWRRLKG